MKRIIIAGLVTIGLDALQAHQLHWDGSSRTHGIRGSLVWFSATMVALVFADG